LNGMVATTTHCRRPLGGTGSAQSRTRETRDCECKGHIRRRPLGAPETINHECGGPAAAPPAGGRGRAGWISSRADTENAKGRGARKKKNMKRGIELERRPRGLYTLRRRWRSRESGVRAHHLRSGDLAGALNRIGASSTGG
jgi:hypothetical protein